MRQVEALGCKELVVQADLSKLNGIEKLFSAAIPTFGRVGVLVNNAGIDGRYADCWEITEAE